MIHLIKERETSFEWLKILLASTGIEVKFTVHIKDDHHQLQDYIEKSHTIDFYAVLLLGERLHCTLARGFPFLRNIVILFHLKYIYSNILNLTEL